MVFPSEIFLFAFLPVVLLCHGILFRNHRGAQNGFLCLASLLFYAWGEPFVVFVLLGSALVNWKMARLIGRREGSARLMLGMTLGLNVGTLALFKYLDFIVENVNAVTGSHLPLLHIGLPIGISFFTFQAISYVIDVYRGQVEAQRDAMKVVLYISLFPQLVAGPIVRYSTIATEMEARKVGLEDYRVGFSRFVVGLAKKTLLADRLAELADYYFDAGVSIATLPAAGLWLGAVAYSFQILFDFSGYSDMAIGLGRMLGFKFEENFNAPYVASSIADFWRRWHISLGSWFRDYVYIPLGGNRVKGSRLVMNLFVVWSLTGLWHGANWTFVLWGLGYFLLLVIEKLTGFPKRILKIGVLSHAYVLVAVLLLWVLFRSSGLREAILYFKGMFGFSGAVSEEWPLLEQMREFGVYLVVAILCCFEWKDSLPKSVKMVAIGTLFLLSVAAIVNSAYCPFIYFNF